MKAGQRAAERFAGDRFLHGYARGKTAWDPAYAAVASRLRGRDRPLLDIGCGVGLLAAYLREEGCLQPILGIEPDAMKVETARVRVGGVYPGLEFRVGTAEDLPDFAGDVVMLDVLHYMPPDVQAGVLRGMAGRLSPGSRMLIRTAFRDGSWRYGVTMLEEGFVRLSGWIRGGRCHFPTREELCGPLEQKGCACTVSPMWGATPFNSHFIEVVR
jgi:2-polyprenyl-3-methyl-5-hydroxy-6-metoxy-1,4-benzoquinol methylase